MILSNVRFVAMLLTAFRIALKVPIVVRLLPILILGRETRPMHVYKSTVLYGYFSDCLSNKEIVQIC